MCGAFWKKERERDAQACLTCSSLFSKTFLSKNGEIFPSFVGGRGRAKDGTKEGHVRGSERRSKGVGREVNTSVVNSEEPKTI